MKISRYADRQENEQNMPQYTADSWHDKRDRSATSIKILNIDPDKE